MDMIMYVCHKYMCVFVCLWICACRTQICQNISNVCMSGWKIAFSTRIRSDWKSIILMWNMIFWAKHNKKALMYNTVHIPRSTLQKLQYVLCCVYMMAQSFAICHFFKKLKVRWKKTWKCDFKGQTKIYIHKHLHT